MVKGLFAVGVVLLGLSFAVVCTGLVYIAVFDPPIRVVVTNL